MLGFDKRAARSTWTAALVLLLLYIVYLTRKTLFVFTLALLFAYLLAPLVNFLDRIFPLRRTRTAALAVAFVIVVAIVVGLGVQIGTRVADEATVLARSFPAMVESWQNPLPNDHSLQAQVVEKIRSEVAARSSSLISGLPQYGLQILSVASNAIYIVIIPVLAFFFLKDAPAMRGHFLDLLDEGPRRALLDDVISDINLLLAHYMRAVFLLSAAAFAAYAIFFSVMRMPYAILLAAAGGLLEFIPMLGPATAIGLILIVAGVAGVGLLPVIAFLVLFRVIQDYVVSPHLMGRGVELHPLLVLFGVFAGAEIAGIAGTLLSVPVLALVRIVYLRIRKARLSARLNATA
jgi:predicted PurR-regulated permease PerM